ncbi:DNA-3-methyladenine glycosylase I [Bombyx mori]|uniref:DNA-3-methyladenine glycosylase I n=1 Tax=Bombyx mori TaxID=7091 RepID=Q1HPJ7_BOMMO|nr:DNA-3-methyladenine glycosylase I [Bombyx mori]ABF51494.1 DNA-3-methyladenine glycosylase I [Bombyx mori]
MGDNTIKRCEWLSDDPLYIKYHDEEWGVPQYDSLRLFEMLCLEGQQAGLSWLTVLKKRENYRQVFHGFDPYKISNFTKTELLELKKNSSIIRHEGKIQAIFENSLCYLQLVREGTDFSDFIWSFVGKKPIVNYWVQNKDIPKETSTSKALAKALKKKGFKFLESKTCYAFMQACGLVNDHIVSCICRQTLQESTID